VIAAVLGGIGNWKTRAVRSQSPQDLAVKTRDIVAKLGYTDPSIDSAFGLYSGPLLPEQISYITEHSTSETDLWNSVVSRRPSPTYFWYRQSPTYLQPLYSWNFGSVTEFDPSISGVAGMISIALEPNGALRYFLAVPPARYVSRDADAREPDWAPLFAMAGLDLSNFTPADPVWTLSVHSDVQASWTGS
jgi:hypothetical protein